MKLSVRDCCVICDMYKSWVEWYKECIEECLSIDEISEEEYEMEIDFMRDMDKIYKRCKDVVDKWLEGEGIDND